MEAGRIFLALVFVAGCFIYFQISPMIMLDEIMGILSGRRLTYKDQVKDRKRKKKRSTFVDIIASSKKTLIISDKGNQFPVYCIISFAGAIAGILLGSLLGNPYVMPVFAIGFAYTPFLIVRLLSYSYQRKLNAELETALSIITTAYQNNENFVAVVTENLHYIKHPIRKVFDEFVFQVEINPSVATVVQAMSLKIVNDTWHEWCDTVTLCQSNKTLRSTLNPIINKFSDIRIVTEDLSYELYDPLKELVIMSSFLLLTPAFIFFASKEWYDLFMHTPVGQIIFAIDMAALFLCLHAGIIHSRPVEYRR